LSCTQLQQSTVEGEEPKLFPGRAALDIIYERVEERPPSPCESGGKFWGKLLPLCFSTHIVGGIIISCSGAPCGRRWDAGCGRFRGSAWGSRNPSVASILRSGPSHWNALIQGPQSSFLLFQYHATEISVRLGRSDSEFPRFTEFFRSSVWG